MKEDSKDTTVFTGPENPSLFLLGARVGSGIFSDSSDELKMASTPFCLRRFLSSALSSNGRRSSSKILERLSEGNQINLAKMTKFWISKLENETSHRKVR